MSNNPIWVKLRVRDPNFRSKLEGLLRSSTAHRILGAEGSGRADLMILELGDDPEKDFQFIHALLSNGSAGEVFVVSGDGDPSLMLQAMRAGVKEFFSHSAGEDELREALNRFAERRGKSVQREIVRLGRIIYVMGSKGGVGTTTVAVNLAVNLASVKGANSVALVDMNMLFGEIPLFLEIKPGNYHWGEIAKNISRLDSTFLMNALYKHVSGIYILPSPAHLNGHHHYATPETMAHLLELMRTMFDFVVVDGGQSLNDTSLKILEMSGTVLLISNLSLPCLSNTKKLLKSFMDLGYPPKEQVRVVINRYLKRSDITLRDVEKGIEQKIFWTIPNDYRTTVSAINQGKALSKVASRAPITKNLKNLADALLKPKEGKEKKGWGLLKRPQLQ
jgi:pilus assembly protein CpaE